jgi:hypothetical protein
MTDNLADTKTDDKLPIVFKMGVGTPLFMFLVCGPFAMVGVLMAFDERDRAVKFGLFGTIHAHTVGWLVALVLGAVSLIGLAMLVLRCPTLTLRQSGIVVARCFHAPVDIPWSALAGITVTTWRRRRNWRTEVVDFINLRTKDGKQIGPGPLGPAADIVPVIRRVAARMGVVLPP